MSAAAHPPSRKRGPGVAALRPVELAILLPEDFVLSGDHVLGSILQCAAGRAHWSLRLSTDTGNSLVILRNRECDGIIAWATRPLIRDALVESGIPFVNVSTNLDDVPPTSVIVDNQAVGEMAARHFVDAGLKRAIFVPVFRLPERRGGRPVPTGFSNARRSGFEAYLRANGIPCRVFESAYDDDGTRLELRAQAASSDGPLGIFCASDAAAARIAGLCRRDGLMSPDDIAILGVNNRSESILHDPPLSSIQIPVERQGREAARLLEHLLDGGQPPSRPILIAPERVCARQSTNVASVADPHVTAALQFIRSHLGEPFGVAQVAAAVSVSPWTLERRFRKALRGSIVQHISEMRLARAKELLSDSSLPIGHVASSVGYASAKYFSMAFRKAVGMSPLAFRRGGPGRSTP